MRLALALVLISSAASAQGVNCVDVDAGCTTSQLNVGPYDPNIGMYPTRVYVEPTQEAFRCYYLTKYIAMCSIGSQGPTGAGGDLQFFTGNHRGLRFAETNEFTPINDQMIVLGSPTYAWAWANVYGYTAKPATVTCPALGYPCVATDVPQSSSVRFNCQEPSGCEYAPDAGCFTPVTGFPICASDGQQLCITNVSAYPLTVREVPGFMEVGGGFRGGLNANICLEYQAPGHWVERSRSTP